MNLGIRPIQAPAVPSSLSALDLVALAEPSSEAGMRSIRGIEIAPLPGPNSTMRDDATRWTNKRRARRDGLNTNPTLEARSSFFPWPSCDTEAAALGLRQVELEAAARSLAEASARNALAPWDPTAGLAVLVAASEFTRASGAYAEALQRLLDCYGLFDLSP